MSLLSYPADIPPSDAWELLAPSMTEERRRRLIQAANTRTRFLRLVIQDIHNPHNVSACMRSAEAFGIQDVDVVTLKAPKFRPSNAARGVERWLSVHKHQSVEACASLLKKAGYVLAAGIPKQGATPLHEIPLSKPIAVIFGNEHKGIDLGWHEHIDIPFTIPMVGMVESLNISVCAAITLHTLSHGAKKNLPRETYGLADGDRLTLLNDWACRHVGNWQQVLQRLRQESAPI